MNKMYDVYAMGMHCGCEHAPSKAAALRKAKATRRAFGDAVAVCASDEPKVEHDAAQAKSQRSLA